MPKLGSFVISRQGFGAMGLSNTYGQADDEESIRTLHRAIELGIDFFDTATGYGAGHNETIDATASLNAVRAFLALIPQPSR